MTDIAVPAAAQDTPRTAYGVLERRATLATVGLLLALAAVAWVATVDNAAGMSEMVQGLAQVGVAMPFDMSGPVFLGMWVTMMVAMMLPTVASVTGGPPRQPKRPAPSAGANRFSLDHSTSE